MVYIGDRDTLRPLDPDALMAALGGEGATMRSRAGKRVVQHVYPEAGIAFAAERDEVKLLEIFPPTTQAIYEAEIHKDPGPYTARCGQPHPGGAPECPARRGGLHFRRAARRQSRRRDPDPPRRRP